ncbi:MAG: hypothetical protein IPO08_20125 [Xanthomonadales bacterium]|nr:hypothetical protein [Xanthomonadales bacterium]
MRLQLTRLENDIRRVNVRLATIERSLEVIAAALVGASDKAADADINAVVAKLLRERFGA